jgi:F1F0 ATPase subunit 2
MNPIPRMSEAAFLVLAGAQGALLGALFFGGLWWTVHRAVSSTQPGIWLIVSLTVRTLIVVAGFWLVSHGDWQRLTSCLLGFIFARVFVLRLTRAHDEKESPRLTKGEA